MLYTHFTVYISYTKTQQNVLSVFGLCETLWHFYRLLSSEKSVTKCPLGVTILMSKILLELFSEQQNQSTVSC